MKCLYNLCASKMSEIEKTSTNSSDKKVKYEMDHDIFQTFLLAISCLFILIIISINCCYK